MKNYLGYFLRKYLKKNVMKYDLTFPLTFAKIYLGNFDTVTIFINTLLITLLKETLHTCFYLLL
jgi:hypothetical protein